jgi:sugar phosphate permease
MRRIPPCGTMIFEEWLSRGERGGRISMAEVTSREVGASDG